MSRHVDSHNVQGLYKCTNSGPDIWQLRHLFLCTSYTFVIGMYICERKTAWLYGTLMRNKRFVLPLIISGCLYMWFEILAFSGIILELAQKCVINGRVRENSWLYVLCEIVCLYVWQNALSVFRTFRTTYNVFHIAKKTYCRNIFNLLTFSCHLTNLDFPPSE